MPTEFRGRVKGRSRKSTKLPIGGRLSVGLPKEQWTNSGSKGLDYFRAKGKNPVFIRKFHETYGDRPNSLVVSFLSSNPAEVCNEMRILRVGSQKFAYGDGVTYMAFQPQTTGFRGQFVKYEIEDSEEARLTFESNVLQVAREYANRFAKPKQVTGWFTHLRMVFWLPQLPMPCNVVLETKGEDTSINNITNTFDSILEAVGRVDLMPFELKVAYHKSDSINGGKYPVITLYPPSADIIQEVGRLGDALYAQVFGTGLPLLSSEAVEKAVKELESAEDSSSYIAASEVPEPPDPSREMEAIAETYFDVEDADAQAVYDDAKERQQARQGLAGAIQKVKSAKDWPTIQTALFSDSVKPYADNAKLREAYVRRAIELADTDERIDSLVKTWKEFHQSEWMKPDVLTARQRLKNGNENPKTEKK